MVNSNWLVVFSLSIMKKYHFYHIKRFSEEKICYTEIIPNFVILHHFSRHSHPSFYLYFSGKWELFLYANTLFSEYSQQSCLSDATKPKGSSNIVLSLEWTFSWNCRIVPCECVMSFFSKGLLLSEITSNSWKKNDM